MAGDEPRDLTASNKEDGLDGSRAEALSVYVAEGDTANPSTEAAVEIDRIARASFPTPVQGAPRGTAATPARRPPPTPRRDNDVSR